MATFEKDDAAHGGQDRSTELTASDSKDSTLPNQKPAPAKRGGTAVSVIVVSLALILLVVWAELRPSFRRCSGMTDVDARATCFAELRKQEIQPPAKGASAPVIPHTDN